MNFTKQHIGFTIGVLQQLSLNLNVFIKDNIIN